MLDEPSVLFLPRPVAHRLEARDAAGAELVCASVDFGIGDENPLLRALPASLVVPLSHLPGLEPTRRLGLARTLLRRGLPVKRVAIDVGYANASALGRVFAHHLGSSPTAWKARDIETRAPAP